MSEIVEYRGVAAAEDSFVRIGSAHASETPNIKYVVVEYSDDGVLWARLDNASNGFTRTYVHPESGNPAKNVEMRSICHSGQFYVIVGDGGSIWVSERGVAWNFNHFNYAINNALELFSVAAYNPIVVALGRIYDAGAGVYLPRVIHSSTNGLAWDVADWSEIPGWAYQANGVHLDGGGYFIYGARQAGDDDELILSGTFEELEVEVGICMVNLVVSNGSFSRYHSIIERDAVAKVATWASENTHIARTDVELIPIVMASGIITGREVDGEVAAVQATATARRAIWPPQIEKFLAMVPVTSWAHHVLSEVFVGVGAELSAIRIFLMSLVQAAAVGAAANAVVIRQEEESYLGEFDINETWVYNTEGGQISRYAHANYTSMVGTERGIYATDGNTLYALDGDDDDGDNIGCFIEWGVTDFGTAFEKSMDRVYLGVSSMGQLVLRVVTNQRAEDWYQVVLDDERGQHGVRMKLGKGLRARYWKFRLENFDGRGFDLESIEFKPLVQSRRVR